MWSASDPNCPRSRNSLDKALLEDVLNFISHILITANPICAQEKPNDYSLFDSHYATKNSECNPLGLSSFCTPCISRRLRVSLSNHPEMVVCHLTKFPE